MQWLGKQIEGALNSMRQGWQFVWLLATHIFYID
jgi:hypothetical protein